MTVGNVDDLAVGTDAVYALYTPAGTEGVLAGAVNVMLARIDRASGAVRRAGPLPGALRIAVGAGSVWIAGGNQYRPTPLPGAIGMVRLDPRSLEQLAAAALPAENGSVAAVAADADQAWLAYGTHLYQLDPKTAAARSTLPPPLAGIASSIAVDPGTSRLYVGSDAADDQAQATVSEWDAATLRKLATATTGGGHLGGPQVAVAGVEVWVAFAGGSLGQVEHRRASDLSAVPTVPGRYSNGVRVYIAGGIVWTTDGGTGQLACLDPVTGAARASTSLRLGGVVAGDSAGLYVGGATGVDRLVPDPGCRQGK